MIFGQHPAHARARVLKAGRAALLLSALALTAASCAVPESTNTANTSGNTNPAGPRQQPTVTIRTSTGHAPQQPQPAAQQTPPSLQQLQPVAASVMNTEVKLLDGSSLKLSDYKGKVVVLDIWATWCGPCRDEIPHLIALGREFGPQGVEVIGLTTEDPTTDEQKVRDFARQFKIDYKVGWIEGQMAATLANGRNAIPQTFVITRDGRLLKHFVGFSPVSSPPMIREAIETAVKL